ncbi:MAG: hypothetical protein KKA84_02305 [Bacteroidetes bacterium]|nr:hypothetical protein [Bacteroidota bacterium]
MKKVFLLATAILLTTGIYSQNKSDMAFVFMGSFGYTVVDVPTAMDIPEVDASGDGLSDWNNYNIHLVGQLIFNNSQNISYGIEAGANRLYWWEEKDSDPNRSPYWYWGEIWTYQVGGIIKFNFNKQFYFLTGASAHIFSNESGTTIGIPAALGYNIVVSKTFEIPIEFRVDVIFGDGTPIPVNGGIGLKFNLN